MLPDSSSFNKVGSLAAVFCAATLELGTVLLVCLREREDLKLPLSVIIGLAAAHEFVQSAGSLDNLGSRMNEQMVGVGKH